jgi:autotransporter translocation and assembly factor TamB
VTEPEALPWGRGELRVVDGTFGAFGQRLEIETGRLIYTGGPLENPGLEIRAVRRVDQVTAGALVRGTLQEPEITLYSDPPMPSAEVLSYLTLGKSLRGPAIQRTALGQPGRQFAGAVRRRADRKGPRPATGLRRRLGRRRR